MVTKQQVLNVIHDGKNVLDSGEGDVGHLRHMINVLTYHLAQTLIGDSKEPAKVR
jgi:hypothetical protein